MSWTMESGPCITTFGQMAARLMISGRSVHLVCDQIHRKDLKKKQRENRKKDEEGWDCEEIKGEQTCFFYLVMPYLWGVRGAREEHPRLLIIRTFTYNLDGGAIVTEPNGKPFTERSFQLCMHLLVVLKLSLLNRVCQWDLVWLGFLLIPLFFRERVEGK